MKNLLFIIACVFALSTQAQVQFTKFKFGKDSPFGCCPGRKMTDAKFNVTADKTIKRISVVYSGVDQVGDAVCSDIVGAVNAGVKHTKYLQLLLVGPFEPGKSYSKWASGTFWYGAKVTAFPQKIEIDYMDKTSETIVITKENIGKYFPKIKWMDVDYDHGFQPDN